MHFTNAFAALVALSSFTNAIRIKGHGTIKKSSPTPTPEPVDRFHGNSFSITDEPTGRKRVKSGPNAIRRTYRKFSMPAPNHILAASSGNNQKFYGIAIGEVAAVPEAYDSEYLSPVQIGNPPRTLMLALDTGSADLWVYSNQMSASDLSGHENYHPGESFTAKQLEGQSWQIQYGDSSGASGDVYADSVSMGLITANNQAVEAATSVSKTFQDDDALDGIIGFGGSMNNQVRPAAQKTWFDTVKDSLFQPVFCAHLKPGQAGTFDFGFKNPFHYQGEIYYTPANLSNGYWEITTVGYNVGLDRAYPFTPITSIVDTGTTLIFMQDDVLESYWSEVPSAYSEPAAGGYIFLCSELLPSFSITVDGSLRIVPGWMLNYAPAGNFNGQDYCFGGIQSTAGLPFNILGGIFLKSQYVVFDVGNSAVGFANTRL